MIVAIAVDELDRLGSEAWPQLRVARDELASYLAGRPDACAAHAADLYLACACLLGAPAAVEAFHVRFLVPLEHELGSLARGPAPTADELRQELAIRLLVSTSDAPARLASYSGKGPLAGWVRIAATRLAIDLQRKGRRERPGSTPEAIERIVEAASVELDGELLSLRERYSSEFKSSLHDALTQLDPAHRAVLRLHYLEGMTTAALAAVYKVSRNTMVRRIANARATLFEATIERLTARVGLPPDQYRTLLQLVRSQLDVSIARLLAEPI